MAVGVCEGKATGPAEGLAPDGFAPGAGAEAAEDGAPAADDGLPDGEVEGSSTRSEAAVLAAWLRKAVGSGA